MSSTQTVKSADRVLTIFELLGQWRDGLTLTELSERLGIPKSSLSQLLKNLVARDWLSYSPDARVYMLGGSFHRIARLENQRIDIGSIVGPTLQDMTERLGESAAFSVLKGHRVEVMVATIGNQRLTSMIRVGDRAPLHLSAAGRVLLAFAPANIIDDYLSVFHLQEQTTPEMITTPGQLRRVLSVVHTEGVSFAHDEPTAGLTEVARPIITRHGELLGALSIAIPTSRYSEVAGLQASDALARGVRAIVAQMT